MTHFGTKKIDLGASYRHENLYGHHCRHSWRISGLCDAYGARGTDPATSRAPLAPAEQPAASHPGCMIWAKINGFSMIFMDFQVFSKILVFPRNAWYCAHLPIARRRLRRELEVPGASGSRFPTGTHALDALESFRNRFGNFYFSWKNHDFRKILKILENPHFSWKSILLGEIHAVWRNAWHCLEKYVIFQ